VHKDCRFGTDGISCGYGRLWSMMVVVVVIDARCDDVMDDDDGENGAKKARKIWREVAERKWRRPIGLSL
jgi:hypothetical protein